MEAALSAARTHAAPAERCDAYLMASASLDADPSSAGRWKKISQHDLLNTLALDVRAAATLGNQQLTSAAVALLTKLASNQVFAAALAAGEASDAVVRAFLYTLRDGLAKEDVKLVLSCLVSNHLSDASVSAALPDLLGPLSRLASLPNPLSSLHVTWKAAEVLLALVNRLPDAMRACTAAWQPCLWPLMLAGAQRTSAQDDRLQPLHAQLRQCARQACMAAFQPPIISHSRAQPLGQAAAALTGQAQQQQQQQQREQQEEQEESGGGAEDCAGQLAEFLRTTGVPSMQAMLSRAQLHKGQAPASLPAHAVADAQAAIQAWGVFVQLLGRRFLAVPGLGQSLLDLLKASFTSHADAALPCASFEAWAQLIDMLGREDYLSRGKRQKLILQPILFALPGGKEQRPAVQLAAVQCWAQLLAALSARPHSFTASLFPQLVAPVVEAVLGRAPATAGAAAASPGGRSGASVPLQPLVLQALDQLVALPQLHAPIKQLLHVHVFNAQRWSALLAQMAPSPTGGQLTPWIHLSGRCLSASIQHALSPPAPLGDGGTNEGLAAGSDRDLSAALQEWEECWKRLLHMARQLEADAQKQVDRRLAQQLQEQEQQEPAKAGLDPSQAEDAILPGNAASWAGGSSFQLQPRQGRDELTTALQAEVQEVWQAACQMMADTCCQLAAALRRECSDKKVGIRTPCAHQLVHDMLRQLVDRLPATQLRGSVPACAPREDGAAKAAPSGSAVAGSGGSSLSLLELLLHAWLELGGAQAAHSAAFDGPQQQDFDVLAPWADQLSLILARAVREPQLVLRCMQQLSSRPPPCNLAAAAAALSAWRALQGRLVFEGRELLGIRSPLEALVGADVSEGAASAAAISCLCTFLQLPVKLIVASAEPRPGSSAALLEEENAAAKQQRLVAIFDARAKCAADAWVHMRAELESVTIGALQPARKQLLLDMLGSLPAVLLKALQPLVPAAGATAGSEPAQPAAALPACSEALHAVVTMSRSAAVHAVQVGAPALAALTAAADGTATAGSPARASKPARASGGARSSGGGTSGTARTRSNVSAGAAAKPLSDSVLQATQLVSTVAQLALAAATDDTNGAQSPAAAAAFASAIEAAPAVMQPGVPAATALLQLERLEPAFACAIRFLNAAPPAAANGQVARATRAAWVKLLAGLMPVHGAGALGAIGAPAAPAGAPSNALSSKSTLQPTLTPARGDAAWPQGILHAWAELLASALRCSDGDVSKQAFQFLERCMAWEDPTAAGSSRASVVLPAQLQAAVDEVTQLEGMGDSLPAPAAGLLGSPTRRSAAGRSRTGTHAAPSAAAATDALARTGFAGIAAAVKQAQQAGAADAVVPTVAAGVAAEATAPAMKQAVPAPAAAAAAASTAAAGAVTQQGGRRETRAAAAAQKGAAKSAAAATPPKGGKRSKRPASSLLFFEETQTEYVKIAPAAAPGATMPAEQKRRRAQGLMTYTSLDASQPAASLGAGGGSWTQAPTQADGASALLALAAANANAAAAGSDLADGGDTGAALLPPAANKEVGVEARLPAAEAIDAGKRASENERDQEQPGRKRGRAQAAKQPVAEPYPPTHLLAAQPPQQLKTPTTDPTAAKAAGDPAARASFAPKGAEALLLLLQQEHALGQQEQVQARSEPAPAMQLGGQPPSGSPLPSAEASRPSAEGPAPDATPAPGAATAPQLDKDGAAAAVGAEVEVDCPPATAPVPCLVAVGEASSAARAAAAVIAASAEACSQTGVSQLEIEPTQTGLPTQVAKLFATPPCIPVASVGVELPATAIVEEALPDIQATSTAAVDAATKEAAATAGGQLMHQQAGAAQQQQQAQEAGAPAGQQRPPQESERPGADAEPQEDQQQQQPARPTTVKRNFAVSGMTAPDAGRKSKRRHQQSADAAGSNVRQASAPPLSPFGGEVDVPDESGTAADMVVAFHTAALQAFVAALGQGAGSVAPSEWQTAKCHAQRLLEAISGEEARQRERSTRST